MKKTLITPNVLPKIDTKPDVCLETPLSKTEQKQFRESKAYKKYVLPILDGEKNAKKLRRKNWWWTRGLLLLGTLFSFIAAMAAVFALLLQLNLI